MNLIHVHPEDLFDKERLGTLTADERRHLDAHLQCCDVCRFERQLQDDFQNEYTTAGDVASLAALVSGAIERGMPEPVGNPKTWPPRANPKTWPPRAFGRLVPRGGRALLLTAAAVFACGLAAARTNFVHRAWQLVAPGSGHSNASDTRVDATAPAKPPGRSISSKGHAGSAAPSEMLEPSSAGIHGHGPADEQHVRAIEGRPLPSGAPCGAGVAATPEHAATHGGLGSLDVRLGSVGASVPSAANPLRPIGVGVAPAVDSVDPLSAGITTGPGTAASPGVAAGAGTASNAGMAAGPGTASNAGMAAGPGTASNAGMVAGPGIPSGPGIASSGAIASGRATHDVRAARRNLQGSSLRSGQVPSPPPIRSENAAPATGSAAPSPWEATGQAAMSRAASPSLTPSTSVSAAETAASLFERANMARRQGRIPDAGALYSELRARYPATSEARLALGLVARMELDRGNAAAALANYNAYLGTGNAALHEEALAGRALALGRLGKVEDERQTWAQLLKQYPHSSYARVANKRLGVDTP